MTEYIEREKILDAISEQRTIMSLPKRRTSR